MSSFTKRFRYSLGGLISATISGRARKPKPSSRFRARLSLEAFEDRLVLSPTVLDPNLGVRTVVTGLTTPTTMAFLGDNDFLVLEKATGKVDHIVNGVNVATK